VLKALSVPSIFPWNKSAVVSKNNSPATSKPSSPPPPDCKPNGDAKVIEEIKFEPKDEAPVIVTIKTETTRKSNLKKPVAKASPVKLDDKTKKSKRLSARSEAAKVKPEPVAQTPDKVPKTESTPKATPPAITPKKKNQVVNFIPGSSIEAQNFDGKWTPVKVVEVDMDEREVLVRSSDKNNKSKTG
jgi:PHD finger protein 20